MGSVDTPPPDEEGGDVGSVDTPPPDEEGGDVEGGDTPPGDEGGAPPPPDKEGGDVGDGDTPPIGEASDGSLVGVSMDVVGRGVRVAANTPTGLGPENGCRNSTPLMTRIITATRATYTWSPWRNVRARANGRLMGEKQEGHCVTCSRSGH